MLRDDDEYLDDVVDVGRIKPETLWVCDRAHVINKLAATFPDFEENRDSMVGCLSALFGIFFSWSKTENRRREKSKKHHCRSSFVECAVE
jgi:hypothetical protein